MISVNYYQLIQSADGKVFDFLKRIGARSVVIPQSDPERKNRQIHSTKRIGGVEKETESLITVGRVILTTKAKVKYLLFSCS
jgi:hypothetical protein